MNHSTACDEYLSMTWIIIIKILADPFPLKRFFLWLSLTIYQILLILNYKIDIIVNQFTQT